MKSEMWRVASDAEKKCFMCIMQNTGEFCREAGTKYNAPSNNGAVFMYPVCFKWPAMNNVNVSHGVTNSLGTRNHILESIT